jgi:hypothetical protein
MESTYFNEEIKTSMIKLKNILREENDDLSPLPDLDKLGLSPQRKEKRLAGFVKMLRNKTMSLQVLIAQAKTLLGDDWVHYLSDKDREYVSYAAIVYGRLKKAREDAKKEAEEEERDPLGTLVKQFRSGNIPNFEDFITQLKTIGGEGWIYKLSDADQEFVMKSAHDIVKKKNKTQSTLPSPPSISDYENAQYRAARRAAFDAQERERARREKERFHGWAPGTADYDDV